MSNLESITISRPELQLHENCISPILFNRIKTKKIEKVKNAGQKVVTPGLRDKVENSGRIPGNPGQLVSLPFADKDCAVKLSS